MADTITTYAHDNAAFANYGRHSVNTVWQWLATNSQRWFRFYGNKLELQVRADGAAGVQISIDGGAYVNVVTGTSGSPAWNATPAWTGAEGWHDVKICHSTGYGTGVKFSLTQFCRITGTDGNEQIAAHNEAGDYERLLEAPFSTYGSHTYPTSVTTASYSSPSAASGVSGVTYGANVSIRRKATWVAGSRIYAWQLAASSTTGFALKIDGANWGGYAGSAGIGNATIGFRYADLPGSGTHEIEIMGLNVADAIMISDTVGGSGAYFVDEAIAAKSVKMVFIGDSQTQGVGAIWRYFSLDSLASQAVNFATYNVGIGGDKCSNMTARFATDVTPHAPEYLLIHAGYNPESTDTAPYPLGKAAYKTLLDTAISQLPSLTKIFCLKLNDHWPTVTAVNTMIDSAVSEWLAANPSWSSKLVVIPHDLAGATTDVALGHISSIGYAQNQGENTGTIEFSGQPSDGDTVTMVSRGVTRIFEFDNNAAVTGSNVSVTVGADAAATNLNLFTAIVAQVEAGWKAKPLIRCNDSSSTGCAVSNLASITESAANVVVTGPFKDGTATVLKSYLGAWPTPAWANMSGETAASLALGVVDVTSNGRKFRCVATNSEGSATSSEATLTVN